MERALKESLADFVNHECELLDAGRFEEWLRLLTPDARYWVPLVHGQPDPEADFSLMIENPLLLRMRIERMRHPSAHGMAVPIHTSRLVGNVMVRHADEQGAQVSARFVLTESENDRQRVFAGQYLYELVRGGASWLMRRKQVNLVNCDSPFASIQIIL